MIAKQISLTTISSLLIAAVLSVAATREARAGWTTASSVVADTDAEGNVKDDKWANTAEASDGDAALYSTDKSNRTGDGAWLVLNFLKDGKGIRSNRLRVNADFWAPIADKIEVQVRYDRETEFVSVNIANGVVPNAAFAELALPKEGLVNAVKFRWHYVKSGYWFWLYELQLFEVEPPPIDPPQCETLSPSSVNVTSAVLRGSIKTDGGGECQTRFVYGTDAALPEGSPATAWTGSFGTADQFTAFVKTLTTGTTYYCRAEVKNLNSLHAGEVKTFVPCAEESEDGSVWVSPVSTETDSHTYGTNTYSWENRANAHDDWNASAARCYHEILDPELKSPWLYLDVHSGLYNGLRFRAAKPDAFVEQIEIEVLSSAWEPIYEGDFTHDTFEVKDFYIREVSQVRVRFKMSKAGVGAYWNLYEFDLRKIGVNLVVDKLHHSLEEFPGVIMGWELGYLERVTAVFGKGVDQLTWGTVELTIGPRTRVFTDTDERQELTGRKFDLGNDEERKLFRELLCNQALLVGGSGTSGQQGEGCLSLALDYDNSVSTDTVKYTFAEARINKTPKFLFASARYATCIEFQVAPAGIKGYEFARVKLGFTTGTETVSYNAEKRVVGVGDDGLVSVGSAIASGDNVFEAYIPSWVEETLDHFPGATIWKPFYGMPVAAGKDSAPGKFSLALRFKVGDFGAITPRRASPKFPSRRFNTGHQPDGVRRCGTTQKRHGRRASSQATT